MPPLIEALRQMPALLPMLLFREGAFTRRAICHHAMPDNYARCYYFADYAARARYIC